MSLTESQIVRYSRQILLREVGGRGQEALLAADVRVSGDGPALETAVAYLEAGGSRTTPQRPEPTSDPASRRVDAEKHEAFVLLAPTVLIAAGADACRACVRATAAAHCPGAAWTEPIGGAVIVSVPPSPESSATPTAPTSPASAAAAASARLASTGANASTGTALDVTATDVNAPDVTAPSASTAELLGALAALAHQRLTLGLDRGIRVARIDENGALATPPATRCEAHR